MRVLAFPKDVYRNPYTSQLYRAVEAQGVEVEEFRVDANQRGDVLHVHWPDWFLARRNPLAVIRDYRRWMGRLRSLKAVGTRIVWTAHNAAPHERRHLWLQRAFWPRFVRMLDGCICLSECSIQIVKAAHPSLTCPIAVVPHGHYRDVYPASVSRSQSRSALGLPQDSFVFVHVGMVRAYKNVPLLIGAFQSLGGQAWLVVAGEVFDPALQREIEMVPRNERTVVRLERVRDEELQTYFRAADVAVFPYRDILNSGSALMALSFDVPVLVPAIGSMPELRDTVGSEWVRTYPGALTPDVLAECQSWAQGRPQSGKAPLETLDWGRLGRLTVEFYRSLASS